jgi:hypothetical protein
MAEGAETLAIFEQLRLELEERINPPIPA